MLENITSALTFYVAIYQNIDKQLLRDETIFYHIFPQFETETVNILLNFFTNDLIELIVLNSVKELLSIVNMFFFP